VKLECTFQQLTQMRLHVTMPAQGNGDLRALFQPLLSGGKREVVFETTIRSAKGRSYPAEICVQYFADEVPNILVAIVHDVSERQQLGAT